MYAHNVVAVFPSLQSAEQAKARLISSGVDTGIIRLSAQGKSTSKSSKAARPVEEPGFFEWLFGTEVPDQEREWYSNNLRDGRTALSVSVMEQSEIGEIEDILEESGAVELDHEGEALSSGSAQTAGSVAGAKATRKRVAETGEEVIPVVNEELVVGKRTTEKRRLVRTHVIERPVQETVELKDETVIVERRPVSGARSAVKGEIQDREFEIIERHQEPVVEKRARAVEEVIIKKNVKSRTETIDDTVRETEVEVEGKTVPKNMKTASVKKRF